MKRFAVPFVAVVCLAFASFLAVQATADLAPAQELSLERSPVTAPLEVDDGNTCTCICAGLFALSFQEVQTQGSCQALVGTECWESAGGTPGTFTWCERSQGNP